MSATAEMDDAVDLKELAQAPSGPLSVGCPGTSLKALLGEGFVPRAEALADAQGLLSEFEWARSRRLACANFVGEVLSAKLVLGEAESRHLQLEGCAAMTRELADALRQLLPEAAPRVKVFSLPPKYDAWNDRWNLDLVLTESDVPEDFDFKEAAADAPVEVPPEFALPQDASPDAAKAWQTIIEVLAEQDSLYSGGHKHVFYTPEQWRDKSMDYWQGAELIVVHDGGSHAPFFNSLYEATALKVRMDLALARAGFYAEPATSWFTRICKNELEPTGAYIEALVNYLRRHDDTSVDPVQEDADEFGFDAKDLDPREDPVNVQLVHLALEAAELVLPVFERSYPQPTR